MITYSYSGTGYKDPEICRQAYIVMFYNQALQAAKEKTCGPIVLFSQQNGSYREWLKLEDICRDRLNESQQKLYGMINEYCRKNN